MGTSKSSTGSGPGVALVPPWVPDPSSVDVDTSDEADGQDKQQASLAPSGRFGPTRRSLGEFARTEAPNKMRRGLGHYIRKGYGGSSTAVQRMAGIALTAGKLYDILIGAKGQPVAPDSPFDSVPLAGKSADEIMDAVAEAVRPLDGTLDAEAGQKAMRNAQSELLEQFPDADLLNLSEEQLIFAVECYLVNDVFNYFVLDVGQTLQDKASSASEALSLLKEVKDYIKQTVLVQFRALSTVREKLDGRRISDLAHQALSETFEIFEGDVR